jgi:curved DNA-binding protein CbpA
MSGDDDVRHVLANQHDYFRLLKVQRTATDVELRSSYKRLALTCHPDKCRHPRAEEAFKAVAKAYDVLSDPTKRRAYERGGDEAVTRQESGGAHPQQRGGGYYRQQPHPQDFFEEFLFGGARRQQQYYYQQQQQQQRNQQQRQQHPGEHVEVNLNFLFIIPVLLAFLLISGIQSTLFDVQPSPKSSQRSSSYSTIPDFRLVEDADFSQIRTVGTHRDLDVKYFVTPRTNLHIERGQYNIRSLEMEVLRQQRESLGRRCESATMRQKARKQHGTPAVCDEYHRLSARVPG